MFGNFGNLFKTRSEHVKDIMDELKDNAYVAPVELPKKPADCHYSVGTDSDGKVVLRVGGVDYVSTTLTMNARGARQLIRMLEAALPEQDETNE